MGGDAAHTWCGPTHVCLYVAQLYSTPEFFICFMYNKLTFKVRVLKSPSVSADPEATNKLQFVLVFYVITVDQGVAMETTTRTIQPTMFVFLLRSHFVIVTTSL